MRKHLKPFTPALMSGRRCAYHTAAVSDGVQLAGSEYGRVGAWAGVCIRGEAIVEDLTARAEWPMRRVFSVTAASYTLRCPLERGRTDVRVTRPQARLPSENTHATTLVDVAFSSQQRLNICPSHGGSDGRGTSVLRADLSAPHGWCAVG